MYRISQLFIISFNLMIFFEEKFNNVGVQANKNKYRISSCNSLTRIMFFSLFGKQVKKFHILQHKKRFCNML